MLNLSGGRSHPETLNMGIYKSMRLNGRNPGELRKSASVIARPYLIIFERSEELEVGQHHLRSWEGGRGNLPGSHFQTYARQKGNWKQSA